MGQTQPPRKRYWLLGAIIGLVVQFLLMWIRFGIGLSLGNRSPMEKRYLGIFHLVYGRPLEVLGLPITAASSLSWMLIVGAGIGAVLGALYGVFRGHKP